VKHPVDELDLAEVGRHRVFQEVADFDPPFLVLQFGRLLFDVWR
jgi:hypothetical protein